jgi:hypothetical protein
MNEESDEEEIVPENDQMIRYECLYCVYSTYEKRSMIRHLNRKVKCSENFKETPIENCEYPFNLQVSETERLCSKCYKVKDNSEFTIIRELYNRKCNDCNAINKEYRENPANVEAIALMKKNHREEHRDEYNARLRDWSKKNREENPQAKLSQNLRSRILKALNGQDKSGHTEELIGCSHEEYRKWMEYNFDSNMTRRNQGTYWDVDHVKPCSSFDLSIPEEQRKCFNWRNTRPLEKSRNNSKGNKIIASEILFQELRVSHYEKKKNNKKNNKLIVEE